MVVFSLTTAPHRGLALSERPQRWAHSVKSKYGEECRPDVYVHHLPSPPPLFTRSLSEDGQKVTGAPSKRKKTSLRPRKRRRSGLCRDWHVGDNEDTCMFGQLALVGCKEQRWCGGSVAGVGVLNNTASNGIVVKSGKQNENEGRITSLQECLPLRSGRLHADQRLCHCLCFLRRRHCPFPTAVRPTARRLLRTLPSSQKFNSLKRNPICL
jgi:hypothetical protein